MKLSALPVLQCLTRDGQLGLVADRWDQISGRPDDAFAPVSKEEKELLARRLAAHRAAPQEALTLEQFKLELARRL